MECKPEDDVCTLIRAAALVGGPAVLAHRLQVPMPEVLQWLAGNGRPSIGIFFRLVDLLVEHSQSHE